MNSTFVIDANILMSILISGKASHKPLLNHYNFIAPEFVLVEIEKYSTTILQKTKMKDDTFWAWSLYVFSQVTILPNYLLSKESLQKSNQLLQNIDLKDTSYVD